MKPPKGTVNSAAVCISRQSATFKLLEKQGEGRHFTKVSCDVVLFTFICVPDKGNCACITHHNLKYASVALKTGQTTQKPCIT